MSTSEGIAIPDRDLLNVIALDLQRPSDLRIETVLAGTDQAAHPSVIWSKPACYAVRAATAEQAQAVRSRILDGSLLDSLDVRVVKDEFAGRDVEVSLKFEIDTVKIKRAVAKSALNFLCEVLGGERARSKHLNALRDFVLNGTPTDGSFVSIDGLDERFATDSSLGQLCKKGTHTLILCEENHEPFVFLSLYDAPYAMVRLTDGPIDEPFVGTEAYAGFFDYTQRSYASASTIDGSFDLEFAALLQMHQP